MSTASRDNVSLKMHFSKIRRMSRICLLISFNNSIYYHCYLGTAHSKCFGNRNKRTLYHKVLIIHYKKTIHIGIVIINVVVKHILICALNESQYTSNASSTILIRFGRAHIQWMWRDMFVNYRACIKWILILWCLWHSNWN